MRKKSGRNFRVAFPNMFRASDDPREMPTMVEGCQGGAIPGSAWELQIVPRQAKEGCQPFAYWFGPTNVHRKWIKGSGKKLWGIDPDGFSRERCPPFCPMFTKCREDLADYRSARRSPPSTRAWES